MANHKTLSIVSIHGPTLTARQELSIDTDWVRVSDHYSPTDLDLLLDQHGCTHTRIFQEFFWLPVCSRRETVFVPVWLNAFCNFNQGHPILTDNVATVDCFNFMIYKQRLPRLLMLTELLNRGLTTDSYIYCDHTGIGFSTPGVLNIIESKYFGASRQLTYNNIANYNNFLRDNVFEKSAVALITETIEPEWHDNMTFTEKTIWAMLSLNFPIWAGGQKQAELWKDVGFDTFDDIVDHSYQYLTDPATSIQQALDSNRRLLTDLPYVSDLRHQMTGRLKQNRQLVIDNTIKKYLDRLTADFDIDFLEKLQKHPSVYFDSQRTSAQGTAK